MLIDTKNYNIDIFDMIKKIWVLVFFLPFMGSSQDTSCVQINLIDSTKIKLECGDSRKFNLTKGRPVCGCDTMTYLNQSCANGHGVYEFMDIQGGCDCIDSSFIDIEGLQNSRNNFETLQKNFEWRDIICGCNGKTYLHPNIALYQDGVTKWTKGPCDCKEDEYIDTSFIDCYKYIQNERLNRRQPFDSYVCGCDSITYFSPCWAMYYGGIFSWTFGKCPCIDSVKIDTTIICDEIYEPVCGCDSITYFNACIAENHFGIIKYTEGECPCTNEYFIDTLSSGLPVCSVLNLHPVCGCDGITYLNKCYAEQKYGIINYKDGLCRCVEEENIDLTEECGQIYRPVCACDSNTYLNICVALNHIGIHPFGITKGPCACYSSNLQDSTYDCNEISVVDYVCGCDSITYINECVAMKYGGVTSWTPGWCTFNCVDSTLIDTMKFCATIYDPVCGCDSITYTNECIAFYRNGMSSWTKGECFTSTKDLDEHIVLKIFPNPTKGVFSINFESLIENSFSIDLLDQHGSLLRYQEYWNSDNIEMNIQGFPNGLYFLRLRLNNNTDIIVKKIIKL